MSFTQSLARGSGRRPWRTVIIWVLALVAAVALTSQLLGDALTSSITFTDEPESITASNLIEEVRGEPTDTEFVVVTSEGIDISDPVYAAYVTEIESTLLGLGPDVVTSVGTYLSETGPVSESGLSALLPVVVAGDGVDETGVNAEVVRDTLADVPAPDGFQALMAGPATLNSDFNTIAGGGSPNWRDHRHRGCARRPGARVRVGGVRSDPCDPRRGGHRHRHGTGRACWGCSWT